MLYIESSQTDPAHNLALEQYAFDTLAQTDDLFMLWQNRDSVIIGIHQNAIEEVNHEFIEKNHIPIVRRLSGGGAVFHDLGNLNFTFITRTPDATAIDIALSCLPIADALRSMGVPVEFSGRNDMTAGGKKFSGNARYYRDGSLMHHGTILFDTDLEKMTKALRVQNDKLDSKSIKSIRSRVVNLREHLEMTIKEFRETLKNEIAGNMPEYKLTGRDREAIAAISNSRYGTWDWNYSRSPKYSIEKRRRLENFGSIRISMSVDKGKIAAFATDGDYFGGKPYFDIASTLNGVKLERSAMLAALSTTEFNEYYENLTPDEFVNIILS